MLIFLTLFFFLGLGIAVLAIGLFVRIIVSFCVVFGSGLTIKEQIFVALAWFPKATVQVKLVFFFFTVKFASMKDPYKLCLERIDKVIFLKMSAKSKQYPQIPTFTES